MSERDGFPAGVPSWVDTLQPDLDAATAFYGGLFGWEFEGPGGMTGHPYLVARLRGRDVAGIGAQPSPDDPAAWNTYVTVDSVDEAARKAEHAGGKVLVAAFDALPAGRMAVLEDPVGAVFCVWQPHERNGAQLVNEPGAWSISQLLTPDPDAAAGFYGALFGWTTESFDMGDSTITMFRLPGYVGGEPQQPVSREVVATMLASDAGPPRWSVDFWVGDADAAVARATELGGRAVVPVFETPVGRTAVVADAHGASFSISEVGGAR